MKKKHMKFTLWSPSAVGSIYIDDQKGDMWVYQRGLLENLRTRKIVKANEVV
jgi:hypothetical protein